MSRFTPNPEDWMTKLGQNSKTSTENSSLPVPVAANSATSSSAKSAPCQRTRDASNTSVWTSAKFANWANSCIKPEMALDQTTKEEQANNGRKSAGSSKLPVSRTVD